MKFVYLHSPLWQEIQRWVCVGRWELVEYSAFVAAFPLGILVVINMKIAICIKKLVLMKN